MAEDEVITTILLNQRAMTSMFKFNIFVPYRTNYLQFAIIALTLLFLNFFLFHTF